MLYRRFTAALRPAVPASCLIRPGPLDHPQEEDGRNVQETTHLVRTARRCCPSRGRRRSSRAPGPVGAGGSATFDATSVSQHSLTTCSVNGGDTYQATRATYTGTSSSSDPRLAGAITIRAWSLVDTTNGVGHVYGLWRIRGAKANAHGTLNAALSGGKASGLATGLREGTVGAPRRVGRRHVRSHRRVLVGSDRLEHDGSGIPPLGPLVPSAALAAGIAAPASEEGRPSPGAPPLRLLRRGSRTPRRPR